MTLTEHGFIVPSRATDTDALNKFFTDYREDTEQMRVTVLTTLQCNFACDYCFQGDHGDHNTHADRMSLDDSARLAAWIEGRLDELQPKRLTLTFFGGEPLLNVPVVYSQAERAFAACQKRGVTLALGIITNGLLLTEELVDRLLPYGLGYVKVTLDGDRDTHNRMRPLRGGQGTFDRIIEKSARLPARFASPWGATSTPTPWRATRHCSTFSGNRTSGASWQRWRSNLSSVSARFLRTSFRSPSLPTSR